MKELCIIKLPYAAYPLNTLHKNICFITCRYIWMISTGGIFGFCFKISYRVFRKNCVFSQFTANPYSPTSLKETCKALNAMRVYNHSFWLVIVCTTNSSRVLARERWQSFENSWKKYNIQWIPCMSLLLMTMFRSRCFV